MLTTIHSKVICSLAQPDSYTSEVGGGGGGESLVKCYTSNCPSASYEARPIRLHLYDIT